MFILNDCMVGGIPFDTMIPRIVSLIIMIIQIAVPIILVVMGMLDLGKAVLAQKEDEIKKGQGLFVKRLIAAVVVFLVVVVVKLVIGIVATGDTDDMWDVFECMTTGKCKCEISDSGLTESECKGEDYNGKVETDKKDDDQEYKYCQIDV